MYVYVVNRRQKRKNRIVKKLMIGDNRRKRIDEIWRWNQIVQQQMFKKLVPWAAK